MGQPAGSRVASLFYDTLLDQHEYWERTFTEEGMMKLQLPHRNDTDGQMLVHQSKHSIARSMISRHNTWFPTYGVMHYGESAYNGAEWTIVGDLVMALNYGAENAYLLRCHFYLKTPSFYQDRLGTNIHRESTQNKCGVLLLS